MNRRAIALTAAILFVLSWVFPVGAGLVRNPASFPQWWGPVDVALAFVVAVGLTTSSTVFLERESSNTTTRRFVLDNHDGKLLPTLEIREQVIREIRQWRADIVIAPRPNDYHPDHRYTGILVQDASYMVIVPSLVADVPALARNPVFLYYSDRFTRPQPFRPDVVVSIDDVFEKKITMLDAHVSQFYEWLPWTVGQLEEVPKNPPERKKWLASTPMAVRKLQPEWREALEKRYGTQAARIQHAEAFEITEYGRQPSEEEIRRLFPFFPETQPHP